MLEDVLKRDLAEINSVIIEGKVRINSISPNSDRCKQTDLVRRAYDAVLEYKLRQCLAEVQSVVFEKEAKLSPLLPLPKRVEMTDEIWDLYELRAEFLRILYRWSALGL